MLVLVLTPSNMVGSGAYAEQGAEPPCAAPELNSAPGLQLGVSARPMHSVGRRPGVESSYYITVVRWSFGERHSFISSLL